MTTTVRYFAPLVWQGAGSGINVRQAAPVVWTQQSVNAYLRNLQAVQWLVSPTPVAMRKATGLQWSQDLTTVTMRRAVALQWTQDQLVAKIRTIQALTWVQAPTQGSLRQIGGYTLQVSSTQGQLRSIAASTLQLTVRPQKTGGLAGLWALIQADAKQAITQSQLSISAPVVDNTQPNCNTYVTVAPIGTLLLQYSGTTKLYYHRTDIANAFQGGTNNTWKLGTIASATTIRALIPQINTAYSLALDPTDVVDGPVAAGAMQVQLQVDPGSYVFIPGTSVFLMNAVTLSTALPNTNLPGFLSAHGNLVDPSLSSIITLSDLPGFDDASGNGPVTYTAAVLADAPYAYYRLTEGSGNVAHDISGNARDGSYVGTVGLLAGQLSSAVSQKYASFPGLATAYVDVTAAKNFCSGNAWTVEAWINVTNYLAKGGYTGSPGGVTVVTDIGDTGTTSPGPGLEASIAATGMYYWPKDNLQVGPIAAGLPSISTMAHVSWVFNNGTLNMYLNGTLVNTTTGATNATIRNFLRLGAQSWVVGAMTGLMGEVALYNKALTQAQLQKHIVAMTPNAPVGQLNFMVPGTYNLVVPDKVFSIAGVGIGSGAGGWQHSTTSTWGSPGGAGGLGWKNNISVTPGETLTVVVGAPGLSVQTGFAGSGNTTALKRGSTTLFSGLGGTPGGNTGSTTAGVSVGGSFTGDGGGQGGGSPAIFWEYAGGAGGAGGYTGAGGAGANVGTAGVAGAGGGGSGGSTSARGGTQMNAGAGGGTGLYGQGASGPSPGIVNAQADGLPGSVFPGSGMFGGGASSGWNSTLTNDPAQGGGLRLIWGPARAYPSTNTQDMNYHPVLGGPADILAHFEGSITTGYGFDQCGNGSAGLFGAAAFSTTASAFGTQSVSLTSGTDCIFFNARGQTDFQATGDFTFDVHLSKKAGATLSAAQGIMCDRQSSTAPYQPQGVSPLPAANAQASMAFYMSATGELFANVFGQTAVDLGYNLWNDIPGSGQFIHVAIQVKGLVLQVFVGGVLKATYTGTTRTGALWTPQINVGNSPTLASPLTTCYIDEVRFVNGLARYSGNFTAPSAPFHMG
jgi:Concanavalin A-like lectin/glucanases superfamily